MSYQIEFTQLNYHLISFSVIVYLYVKQILSIRNCCQWIWNHNLVMLVIKSNLVNFLLLGISSTYVLIYDKDKSVFVKTILICVVVFNYLVSDDVKEIPLLKTNIFHNLILQLKFFWDRDTHGIFFRREHFVDIGIN